MFILPASETSSLGFRSKEVVAVKGVSVLAARVVCTCPRKGTQLLLQSFLVWISGGWLHHGEKLVQVTCVVILLQTVQF